MTPAAPSPLLKLFGVDRTGPGHSLQHIRDKIYSHAWSRVRRDDHKLDFVISETGINRNVPERLLFGEDTIGVDRARRVPPPPCNLYLVNKQVSDDFIRYIYNANDLEVDLDLKAMHTTEGQAALNRIAILLRNPNFQKFTRNVRVRVHLPSNYPVANLPDLNQSALDSIACALDDFQRLGHLAIRMVPGLGAPLDYELRLVAFPFYPMRMTNWTIRILNAATFPYTWDLVDKQTIALLNQAYEVYQQTGSLTAPIVARPIEEQLIRSSLGITNKNPRPSSSSFRQPMNGSQKRRERKKRAAEAAEQAIGIIELPGPKANVTRPMRTGAEAQPHGLDANSHDHIAGKFTVEEQSLDPESGLIQVSGIEHSRPTLAPSPPLSPVQKKEAAHASDFHLNIGLDVPSPAQSSDGEITSGITASEEVDVGAQKHPEFSSPASSATLVPMNISPAFDRFDDEFDAAGDADGNITQLQQAKKKRRNKKGKNRRTKSKAVQSAELHHHSGSGHIVGFEIDIETTDHEHHGSSNNSSRRPEESSVDALSSDSNRFDLSQGTWSPFGATHASFTRAETGRILVYPRDSRVERYLRQQDRILAARAEAEERQKEAKAKNQTRRARQILLRRDHIAANSPLSRAMGRPCDNSKKQVKSKSRSTSPSPDEETVRAEIERNEVQERAVQQKIREIKSERDRQEQRGFQRIAELQDLGEGELKEQLNSGRAAQTPRFNFGIDIDSDNDSVDSLALEHQKSIVAEGSGEMLEVASLTDNLQHHGVPHELYTRFQESDSELYRIGSLGTQPSEDGQYLAETDSLSALEDPVENDEIPKLCSPVGPMVLPHGKQEGETKKSDIGMTHTLGLEKIVLCERPFPERKEDDDEQDAVEGIDLAKANTLHQIHLEYDPDQKPLARLCDPVNDYTFEPGQCSAEKLKSKTSQRLPDSDQRQPEGEQLSPEEPMRREQARYRGVEPSARGSYCGNRHDGRTKHITPRIEQVKGSWATAVQAGDKLFMAQGVERRLAVEQEMQAKGTDYTDYATPIEDNYTKLGEDREFIEREEKIVYGPQSQVLSPSDEPVLGQEVPGAGTVDANVAESRGAESM